MKAFQRTSQQLAVLLAMTAGAVHSAQAFSIDSSQQRVTQVQPAQSSISHAVYVQPAAQVSTVTNVSVQAAPQGYTATRVNVTHSRNGRGKLVIHYHSLDELDGILERIR